MHDSGPIQICKRCIINSTVPGVTFDENTICNFCHLHDKMEKRFPIYDEGLKKIKAITKKIKHKSKGKKYNCIVGVSGGRDSTYTLLYVKKVLELIPLAVHFNDGFGNPIAGENMVRACKKLNVELRTITSDWRESKDIKIAFLKASTPDLEEGTDIGIATALYGVASKENIKYIFFGQSFRTEGIAPLTWNYLDGMYLKEVHKKFGSVPLRKWKPTDPGFNLDMNEIFYYTIYKGIKTIPILYYLNYERKNVDELLKKELGWNDTGAHYYDDLYQAFMTYVYRIKFNINRRLFNYSALVRSGQMTRQGALDKSRQKYVIEDPKIIDLCIKRLGITKEEFEGYMSIPVKTFRDYPNRFNLITKLKLLIIMLSKLHILPGSTYDKYFNCG